MSKSDIINNNQAWNINIMLLRAGTTNLVAREITVSNLGRSNLPSITKITHINQILLAVDGEENSAYRFSSNINIEKNVHCSLDNGECTVLLSSNNYNIVGKYSENQT